MAPTLQGRDWPLTSGIDRLEDNCPGRDSAGHTPFKAIRVEIAAAILDRLLHHCDVISINGPSYRLRNRLAALEAEAKPED
jgi:hypothetical protein